MSGFFQRLFGKDNKPAIARGPLGLHLNSGFTLDTLAFRLLEDELLIALPGEEFTVAAVSHIDLGGVARFSVTTLRAMSSCKSIPLAAKILMTLMISSSLSMKRATVSVKRVTGARRSTPKRWGNDLKLAGKRWQRFFNSEEPGNIEPVYMLEKVENQNHAKWEVHNFSMGYQRQVTGDTYEYLLLNGEESFNDLGEPEWLFSRALGVDIPLTSLHIIG